MMKDMMMDNHDDEDRNDRNHGGHNNINPNKIGPSNSDKDDTSHDEIKSNNDDHIDAEDNHIDTEDQSITDDKEDKEDSTCNPGVEGLVQDPAQAIDTPPSPIDNTPGMNVAETTGANPLPAQEMITGVGPLLNNNLEHTMDL